MTSETHSTNNQTTPTNFWSTSDAAANIFIFAFSLIRTNTSTMAITQMESMGANRRASRDRQKNNFYIRILFATVKYCSSFDIDDVAHRSRSLWMRNSFVAVFFLFSITQMVSSHSHRCALTHTNTVVGVAVAAATAAVSGNKSHIAL